MDLHTPLEALALTGQTPGISGMLHFVFWEQYLKDHGEKPFQQYLKEDHDEKTHQPYMSLLDKGHHPELEIVRYIEKFEGHLKCEAEQVKFRVKVGGEKFEDLGVHDEMCGFIGEQAKNEDGTWRLRKITCHRTPEDNARKTHEVLTEWECTYEPISIYEGDKYLLAEYTRDHDLLDEWESPRLKLKQAPMNSKKLLRMINQDKPESHRTAPVYMYDHEVPRNDEQAIKINATRSGRDTGYKVVGRPRETRTHNQVIGGILSGIILFLSTFIFDAAVYDGQMNEKEIYCLIDRGANHCMFDGLWKDDGEHSKKAELPGMLDDGEHSKAIIYDHFRKDAEELHNDKCSRTFWGDIHLRLENATLVHLNTVKLARGTAEKALMREMEDSDDIALERRLEIIRNMKGVNAREVGNHELSDEGSGLIYTLSNGRGVTNGYAFG